MSDSLRMAKDKALKIIERRMVTKKELREKLLKYDFEKDVIDEVVLWAEDYNFVDDREYARVFTADAVNLKKWGERRIRQALLFKGVASDIIDEGLEEFDFSELNENLFELVKRKLNGDFERKSIDRAVRHFIGKGYDYSQIKNALDKVREEYEGEI